VPRQSLAGWLNAANHTESEPMTIAGFLRAAIFGDLASINAIYTHSVLHSTATYQTEPSADAERAAWFAAHGSQHPVIVAEIDGRVVGWGSLSPFHQRGAFNRTVEESVYIHHDFHRRGIGKAILSDLLAQAKALGHHRVIAAISGDQEPSLALHRQLGFVECGRLSEVGFKFGRWLDLVYLEHRLV
jgi:L-amino acid N-acyltransferase YncA